MTTQQYTTSGVADAYVIGGAQAAQVTTDAAAISPFAGLTISNPAAPATGIATVTLSTTANGSFSNLGAGTLSADGATYSVSGTPAAIQAALRALVFTPTDHEVAPGQSVSTGFALSVTDGVSTATDNTNSVVATAVEDAPVITGASSLLQIVNPGNSISPFFGFLTITDPDFGASETATVTLTVGGVASDANGTLSGTGLSKIGVGTYQFPAGSPVATELAVRALSFTPAPLGSQTSATTGLTLQVSDGIAPAAVNTNTVIETIAQTPVYITVAPVSGVPNIFNSSSTTTETTFVTTPISQTVNTDATTITALLNGQIIFQQSFPAAFSDPTVQAAVTQADLILASDHAVSGAPSLTASAVIDQGSQSSTVQTGQSNMKTIQVTTNFGPGTLGPAPTTSTPNLTITLLAGQEDSNVNIDTQTTIDQTVTTTTTLQLTQNYSIDGTVACFAAGTRLLAARGEIAVETLAIGDMVPTRAGGLRPIHWIGHRHVDCRRHPKPQNVWPVRVRPGAFGDGMPCRDLLLSPDHAVYVDGLLIPIRHLMNGTTIAQEEADEVTYWHVELHQHDVILAEGLPCESYLDTGNRGAFACGGPAMQLHPDFSSFKWEAEGCAPLIVTGPELEAARQPVNAFAETTGQTVSQAS